MLIRWYLAYFLSHRNVEEFALERGIEIDHTGGIFYQIDIRQIKYLNNIANMTLFEQFQELAAYTASCL